MWSRKSGQVSSTPVSAGTLALPPPPAPWQPEQAADW